MKNAVEIGAVFCWWIVLKWAIYSAMSLGCYDPRETTVINVIGVNNHVTIQK